MITKILLCVILSLLVISSTIRFGISFHDLGFDTVGILKVNDPHLGTKEVAGGLRLPTHMAFLGLNDMLVLEKNNGTVRRIINGNLLPQSVLDVNVANKGEKGMLGITVSKNQSQTYVFLYFTESKLLDGGRIIGNMLYRYELIDNKLLNPKLLMKLPATWGPYHHGGALSIGPDGFVYLSVGDIHGVCEDEFINEICSNPDTKVENYVNGLKADGRAGILRVTQDGKIAGGHAILGKTSPLDKYFAYGIRNSFGMDFDPITGKLWETENGGDWGDEINLVEPGFNSGWSKVQGIWTVQMDGKKGKLAGHEPDNLTNFEQRGKYSSPEFIWNQPVGPTAIKFLNSNKYGEGYKNSLFVADANYGRIYNFNLNNKRTGFVLDAPLADRIADTDMELDKLIFAKNFGIITDLKVGPDGLLYILTYGSGKIFKIVTEHNIPR